VDHGPIVVLVLLLAACTGSAAPAQAEACSSIDYKIEGLVTFDDGRGVAYAANSRQGSDFLGITTDVREVTVARSIPTSTSSDEPEPPLSTLPNGTILALQWTTPATPGTFALETLAAKVFYCEDKDRTLSKNRAHCEKETDASKPSLTQPVIGTLITEEPARQWSIDIPKRDGSVIAVQSRFANDKSCD